MRFAKPLSVVVLLLLAIWAVSARSETVSAQAQPLPAGSATSQTTLTSDYSFAGDVEEYLDNVDAQYGYDIAMTLAYDPKYWDNGLGWRSAGSDAEHRCADYLFREMKAIGLQGVEKVAVPCDRFQFNDSSLTIDGTAIDLTPASYHQTGTGPDGITAEMVDCGTGFEADYEGQDVAGKIVLVQVDQANEAWIDGYIREAHLQGAAALVTWANSGYGELNLDTINVQDTCCDDLLPTAAISANQAAEIKQAIEAGHSTATLMIDAVLEQGKGVTYNVVGRIKGKDSSQQTLISGHYDKYWFGFQDDCIAIGNVLGMAKALKASGYRPENDLVFICHGAEEWGRADHQDDWTTGAWGMVNHAKPHWQAKTKGLFNFELNAIDDGTDSIFVVSVPELSTFVKDFVTGSGLVKTSGHVTTVQPETADADTMEDGVSYRWAGIPYMVNGFQSGDFSRTTYHTQFDTEDTFDEDVYVSNANLYGAMVIYTDKMPAMELDLRATCDDLEEALNEETARQARADVRGYKAALCKLRRACERLYEKTQRVNAEYEALVDAGHWRSAWKCRARGARLNRQVRAAFKQIQKQLIGTDVWGIAIRHAQIDANIAVLQGVIDGLEREALWTEQGDGALDVAFNLNGVVDYNYYIFSKAVADQCLVQYDDTKWTGGRQFLKGKLPPVYWVGDMTYGLVRKDAAGEPIDYRAAKAVYKAALREALCDLRAEMAKETCSMRSLTRNLHRGQCPRWPMWDCR